MSLDPPTLNHYEVLGVPPDASLQEIKARYRELVRLYHPDATGGTEATNQQIVRINQAYKALTNPAERARIDEALRREAVVKERMARAQRAVEQRGKRADAASSQPVASPEKLLKDAELALSCGNYRDASEICYRILKFDSRSARAYALLGDIAHVRGNRDDAIANYTMAAQLEPANTAMRGKLKRLMDESEAVARHAIAVRGRPMLAIPPTPAARISAASLCAAALLAPFMVLGDPGTPMFPGVALISYWSERLLATLLGASFLLGLGLSFAGLLRRIEDDLLVERGDRGAPLGIFLIIGGVLFYFLSLLFYILSGLLQDNFSPSLNVIYALSTLLVIAFSAATGPAAPQVLLLGGNVIFVAMLFGWFLGDILHNPA